MSRLNLFFVALVLIFISIRVSHAKDFIVGGNPNSWSSPSASNLLNQWAESNRFQVGDSLVWKYDSKKDSVMEVSREAYLSCNTTNPIAEYNDGETRVKFDRSGPYYFISGAPGACDKGEKLVVVVMAERRRHFGHRAALAPAMAPSALAEIDGPAVAPTSGSARVAAVAGGAVVAAVFMALVVV